MTGSGVGVGPCAIVGADGVGETIGSADGPVEGSPDGGLETDGCDEASVDALGAGFEGTGDAGGASTVGLAEARAMSLGGVARGATAPAVSATVARMRFKTPMATTRRAR